METSPATIVGGTLEGKSCFLPKSGRYRPRLASRGFLVAIVISGILLIFGSKSAEAQTVATPTISPSTGSSYVQVNATLTDSTPGATIYYAFGSAPNPVSASSVTSGGTVLISKTETLYVMATLTGYTNSGVASAAYEITGQLAAGQYHAIALRSDGTVWTWGINTNGQLGDGTLTQRNSPEQVTSLSGIVAVAAGGYHSVALKSDGTVWTWGYNGYGTLGDNTTTQRNSPVEVKKSNGSGGTTNLTGIVAICAGAYHTLALDSSGNVWAWGLNSSGQLGDGTTTEKNMAEQLTTLSGVSVQALASGYYHSFVLTTSGTVEAWGLNSEGQIGDGTTTQRNSPVAVSGLSGVTITALAGGMDQTLALANDATVWAWGGNGYNQIGNTWGYPQETPAHLSGLSGVTAIAAGNYVSAIVKSDGTVHSWGYNQFGVFGDGTEQTAWPTVYSQMLGVTGAVQTASGNGFSVTLQDDGRIWCSGYNPYGELGNGYSSLMTNSIPVSLANTYTAISAGYAHDVLLKSDGTVWCMGDNIAENLGDGTLIEHGAPVQVTGLTGITGVSAGFYHSLAVKSDGSVWGWGSNSDGEIGIPYASPLVPPIHIGASTSGFTGLVQVQAGYYTSYALKGSDGTVWNWGGSGYTPTQVSGLSGVTSLSVAQWNYFAMALKGNGTVWTWGLNYYGELGNGTTTNSTSPVEVMENSSTPLTNIVAIQQGSYAGEALDSSGHVWVWGYNGGGGLGDGTTTNRYYAVMLTSLSGITKLGGLGSATYTLAWKNDGTLWGWGYNWNGELGQGNQTGHNSPIQLTNFPGVVSAVGGQNYSLMLKEDGHLEASGNDYFGAIGTCVPATPAPIWGVNALAPPTPTVSITGPSNNATVSMAQTQTFTASASETGGNIASVSYYVNSNLIGTSTSGSSFSFNWTPPTWGNFTFTAVATDTNGQTSAPSSPLTLQVPYDSDSNGLPDWWEMKYFGHIGNNPYSSPDGNGNNLLSDYSSGADPTNYYDFGGGQIVTPVLTILSGNNQYVVPGGNATAPLVVNVVDSIYDQGLSFAPVNFSTTSGGLVSLTGNGTDWASSVTARADFYGTAQVYYQGPSTSGITDHVTVTAAAQSIAFTESTASGDGTFDAPSNCATTSPTLGEIDLSWANHASTATGILIQQSTDGLNWTDTTTLTNPATTTYAVTGLIVGQSYYFRIFATK